VLFIQYFKIIEEEVNKEVIEKTLECIAELLDEFGPSVIGN